MTKKENLKKIQEKISLKENRRKIQSISLGAVPDKELKREMKALKVLAEDPVVKTMMRAKTFAKWGGSIECCDSTLVSILLVDRFGARTAYGIPSELMDAPETLAELSDKPERMLDWIHVANLVNRTERNRIVCQQEISVEQFVKNGGLEEDAASFRTEMLGTSVAAVLQGKREAAAALIAALDEQFHTILGSTAPRSMYIFEVPDEQAAEWLRSLMETLTVQTGSLCLREKGTGALVLGPDDSEAEVVRLPMRPTLPKLTQKEKDILAEYVRRSANRTVMIYAEVRWEDAMNAPYPATPAQEWRTSLAYDAQVFVVNNWSGDKNLKKAFHMLDNIMWPKFIEV